MAVIAVVEPHTVRNDHRANRGSRCGPGRTPQSDRSLGVGLHDARLVRICAVDQNLDFRLARVPAPGEIGWDLQYAVHLSILNQRFRFGQRVSRRHHEIRRKLESSD